jgi:gamma-butyrobetaine dioxygenase
MITHSKSELAVTWPDGFSHRFHPLWLRERSFEESNKDATTGHRVVEVALFPVDLSLVEATEKNGRIDLAFADGHHCSYALDDLRNEARHPLPDDLVGAKQLWDAKLDKWPHHEASALIADDCALLALIDDLARLGFALIGGLGTGVDDLKRMTSRIGRLRATNWGTIADVKNIAEAYDDLSMTGRALEPHVDNPYRLPGPGYIFLHCLESSAEGGESLIVDGFHVARMVEARNRSAFETLATTPVGFHYADCDAILDHAGPLIELGPDGELHRVRFHNRAEQVPAYSLERLASYYEARRIMAEEVWSQANTLRFTLRPGDVYVVDNYRLLHGRTEIQLATGNRHMRQCYMDRDMISSRQKVLRRQFGVANPVTDRSSGVP